MPRVKIDYIVSFSDEDPEHPASNLLSKEVDKRRWLCRPGESSCSVVLQLTHAVQISAIHIGSYHAAVIEVLVGRSETPNDPFEVLVPSSVFLSPVESRREAQDRVRSFSGDQLATATRADRVRVMCRQPYNKQCKYGLSFIHIYEPESGSSSSPAIANVSSPVPTVASRAIAATTFGNSSSDDEDYRPGQLFAASSSPGASTSTGTQIRQATSKILKNISDTSSKIVKSPIVKQSSSSSKQNTTEPNQNRHRNSLMYTDDEEQPNTKIDTVVQRHNDERLKEKEAKEAKEKAYKEKMKKEKQAQSKKDENRKDFSVFIDNDDHKDTNDKNSNRHKETNNNHNTRTDKKDDASKRQENNVGHRNRDDKAKLDRSIDDKNKQKHRQDRKEEVRPGGSNDSSRTPKRERDRDEHRKTGVKRQRTSKDNGLQAGPVSSTPETLLSHCSLVFSGYVHPRRGNIRKAALACGATVLPDWGPRATHLICAFPNTPKLHQALSSNPSTPIATGEWVEKCCELRRLLPWEWFATEPGKRVPMPDLSTLDDGEDQVNDEDCDTDEEIEKVLREQKKRRRSNTPETQTANTSGQNDSLDEVQFVKDERIKGNMTVHDSDSDGDKTVDGSRLDCNDDEGTNIASPTNEDPSNKIPSLPNFFDGHTFAIATDVSTVVDVDLLKRYVRAYGGVLVEDWSPSEAVDFVLCGDGSCPMTSQAACVRADWVWRCHDKQRICNTDRFLVTPES